MTDQDPRPEGSVPETSEMVEESIVDGDGHEPVGEDGPEETEKTTSDAGVLAGADEQRRDEESAGAPAAAAGAGTRGRGAGRAADETTTPGKTVDELPYVDDPVTKWWVGIVVAVFVAIFAYAVLLGRGGILSDLLSSEPPVPMQTPTLSPAPSPSPEPGSSPEASPTAAVASPSPASTPGEAPSEAPTPAPTASPPPTPAPTAPDGGAGSPGPTAEPPPPGS